ncbi:GAF domain-containing protein [Nonomuraea insulae]|uniref:GAF domain-containing protein n=1 Tax=Nonomuraea insulae TaxID=1616787 RepID=A0ABW1DC56_9ACTN
MYPTFQHVCDQLLEATRADRITLRLDGDGLHVDLPAAEARRTGVRSLLGEAGLDQRALATVRWLDAERRLLVQPGFTGDPMPPQELIDVYGVRAQMLGPLVKDGEMYGWLSVHSLTPREWTAGDQAALAQAIEELS